MLILRLHKKLLTLEVTSNAIQNYDPYKQKNSELFAARQTIAAFANDSKATTVFKQLDKTTFVASLRNRIDDPEDVDQDQLNLCGAATFTNVWLQRDPEGYAKAAI